MKFWPSAFGRFRWYRKSRTHGGSGAGQGAKPLDDRRTRLQLEALEDRAVPAISLSALTPGGSLIYQGSEAGSITSAGAVATHSVSLDANQILSVKVTPAAGLSVAVQLESPLGGVIGGPVSAAAGQTVVFSGASVATSGSYVVRVTGQATGTGSYSVEATTNAIYESEATGAATNDTAATAESLTAFTVVAGPSTLQTSALGNLSGGLDSSDYYAIAATAGQRISIGLVNASTGASFSLAMLNQSEVTVASGVAGATNLSRAVVDYPISSDGVFFAKITGTGSYRLVVSVNAGFEVEGNSSLATAQVLSGSGRVIGNIGGTPPGSPAGSTTSISLPFTLQSGLSPNNFDWEVDPPGSIFDGLNDAYDGGMLHVNFPSGSSAVTEDGGREVVIGPRTIVSSGMQVTRKVFAPAGTGYARFLEIVTNPTASAASYSVQIDTNLGSDGSESSVGGLITTSSGDSGASSFTTADNWIITDDTSSAVFS